MGGRGVSGKLTLPLSLDDERDDSGMTGNQRMVAAEMNDGLTPPVGDGDHIRGAETAAVTVVQYGDFECPFCGEAYRIVRELERRYEGRVRFVFRHFPLPQVHPYAQRAAEVAEAAAAQGKFWQMHDYLFEHQPSLAVPDLLRYASDLGLDVGLIRDELDERVYRDRVLADVASGEQSGVPGTPGFFVNGRFMDQGWDLRTLLAAIEAEL
jgi:protein-disulfide isomerase